MHALALRAARLVADPTIDQWDDGYRLITALQRADEHEALAVLTARMEQASAWPTPSHSDSAEADRHYGTITAPADWTGYGYEPDSQPSPPWDWFDLA